jgi:hypothetical protein
MKPLVTGFTVAAILGLSLAAPMSANAGNGGAVAAGIAGGLIGGAILGSALAGPRYEPAPVYVAPPPPPPPDCYWTRGEPYWDDWRGAWVRPRVRVCD